MSVQFHNYILCYKSELYDSHYFEAMSQKHLHIDKPGELLWMICAGAWIK